MVDRSHVFNLRGVLKDRFALQELAGDIKSRLCSFSTARNISCSDEHTLAIVFQGQSHVALDSL